eukprot:TRINITY_DN178_c1_g1_i1.p1 TRINITY_DN178_c1_g1~~TRINITY_DN178_c1_g1_i1.p1  ORF type:complete len:326 (+),score=66.48 TRINITY_DN178_c1_g1_i1:59-1036(+)
MAAQRLALLIAVAQACLQCRVGAASLSCSVDDELPLIQQESARRRHRHRGNTKSGPPPQLGKVKLFAVQSDFPGLDDVMAAAIKKLASRVNKSMDTVDKRATDLARKATAAQRRFVVSVNATLARKISALVSLANATLADASEVWESTGTELDGLASILSQGLRTLGKAELASTVTDALNVTVERVNDVSSWITVARDQSASLALDDAARGLSDLRSTLVGGSESVGDFVSATGASFDSLAEGAIAATQDTLPEAVAKVVASGMLGMVRRVKTSAENLHNLTANVTSELIGTIDDVSSEVEKLGGNRDGEGILSTVKHYLHRLFR